MAINVQCNACGKSFNVPESFQGKRAKCPCGSSIKIYGGEKSTRQRPGMKPAREHIPIYNKQKSAPKMPQVSHHRASDRYARPSSNQTFMLIGIGAAVVAVVAVVIVMLLSPGTGTTSRRGGEIPVQADGDEKTVTEKFSFLSMVPANALAFGMIDVKQLSALGVLDSAEMLLPPVLIDNGLDPNDINAWYFVAGPGEAIAAIASGNMDANAVRGAASAFRRTSYRGQVLGDAGDELVFGMTSKDLLVLGDDSAVKAIVDVIQGDPAIGSETSPAQRAAALEGNAIWLVARLDSQEAVDMMSMMPGLEMGEVKTLALSGNVLSNGLFLKLDLDCRSADTAREIVQAIRQSVQYIPMPGLLPTLRTTVEGNVATLTVHLRHDDLEVVKGMLTPEIEIIETSETATETVKKTQEIVAPAVPQPPAEPVIDQNTPGARYDALEGKYVVD